MISLLTLIINAAAGALIYAIKAFFSLVKWIVRSFFNILKLIYVVLPFTSIVLVLLFGVIIFFFINNSGVLPENVQDYALIAAINNIIIPGSILFYTIVADAFIYVIRAVFGKGFIRQALDRYFRLFPEAARRHYEKNYDKFLNEKKREIEEEKRALRRRKKADFYEDFEEGFRGDDEFDEEFEEDDYEDDEFDEEYSDGEEYADDDYYEDEYDEDYQEDDYEDYEDLEDDYDDPGDRRRYREESHRGRSSRPSTTTSFDFFAGCSSRESVDKKYKSLVKLYHPDNMDGDTAALQEINYQYSEAKKRFS